MQHRRTGRLGIALIAALGAAHAGDDHLEAARRLAQDALIVDTHIDVPYRLREHWEDVTTGTAKGEFDWPRARVGGLDVVFMSIYTPGELEAQGTSTQLAHELIDSVEAMAARAPGRYVLVRSSAEAERVGAEGRIGLALGMENGSPLAGDIGLVQTFHARGVRYVTLAHGLSNALSDSSYDAKRPHGGLSDYGRQVVAEMNRLGMMIDVSHLSDEAVRDVLAASRAPVIASHSSARHFTPGFERNLDDALIRAIGEAGGVVQINFGSSFLTAKANAWTTAYNAAEKDWLAKRGLAEGSAEAKVFEADYRKRHPYPFATVDDVADHIDHVVKLAGIGAVGLGSDYDGVGDSLPEGLKTVADYPNLIAELMRRGYDDAQLRAILGGNLMRVWREVEKRAG